MPPTAACTICTLTSSVESFSSDCASASCEPCTSALMMSGSVLTCALRPSGRTCSRASRPAGLRQLDVAVLALAEGRDLARTALVGQHHELVAGLRHFGQALDLDRDRRAGLVDRLAVLVEHRAHAAEARAGQHDVAALQRAGSAPAPSRPGRGPCRAAPRSRGPWPARRSAPSAPALRPAAAPARAASSMPCAGLGRHRHERRIAAEFFRHDLLGHQLAASRARGWRSGLSILFIATTIGTPAAFAWCDRFLGLRHHAVVGRDHQDHDVGRLARRAHASR